MKVLKAIEWYCPTGVSDSLRRQRDMEPTLVDHLTAKVGDYWRDPWEFLANTLPVKRRPPPRKPSTGRPRTR